MKNKFILILFAIILFCLLLPKVVLANPDALARCGYINEQYLELYHLKYVSYPRNLVTEGYKLKQIKEPFHYIGATIDNCLLEKEVTGIGDIYGDEYEFVDKDTYKINNKIHRYSILNFPGIYIRGAQSEDGMSTFTMIFIGLKCFLFIGGLFIAILIPIRLMNTVTKRIV